MWRKYAALSSFISDLGSKVSYRGRMEACGLVDLDLGVLPEAMT